MTPTQTKRAIEIMQKHGQDGWKIEFRCLDERNWSNTESLPSWNWLGFTYRAVGPRKRVELKRGMEVRGLNSCSLALVVHDHGGGDRVSVFHRGFEISAFLSELTHYRWPNGNGEWLPIEGEPEIISMEGVE